MLLKCFDNIKTVYMTREKCSMCNVNKYNPSGDSNDSGNIEKLFHTRKQSTSLFNSLKKKNQPYLYYDTQCSVIFILKMILIQGLTFTSNVRNYTDNESVVQGEIFCF